MRQYHATVKDECILTLYMTDEKTEELYKKFGDELTGEGYEAFEQKLKENLFDALNGVLDFGELDDDNDYDFDFEDGIIYLTCSIKYEVGVTSTESTWLEPSECDIEPVESTTLTKKQKYMLISDLEKSMPEIKNYFDKDKTGFTVEEDYDDVERIDDEPDYDDYR